MSSEAAPNNSTSATNDQMDDYNHVINHENTTRDAIIDEHKKALKFIEDVTTNAAQVQRKVLYEILSTNAHVEYLKRHGLDGEHTDSVTIFKKVIPVVTYEDLKPDIDRIANGDTSPILCAQPISEFYYSSGTSGGKPKLIPATQDKSQGWFIRKLVMPILNQYVPGLDDGKAMYFLFVKPQDKTQGGQVGNTYTTGQYKSSHFTERPYDPYNNYTSPDETILCEDSYQSKYSQLLCGLYQNHQVLRVGSIFATGLITMMRFLQKHWKLVCNDIRTGTIDARITDQSVREAVLKILNKPNPKLADFIETECSRDSWQGIISRLWPNTKLIDAIITGSMSQYIPILDYYSNSLPIVSLRYASSECYLGINLKPLCKPNEVSYTLIPSMAYFEFLPVDQRNNRVITNSLIQEEQQQQELVDLVDVKLGHEYELVITTYAGLYRYRVGDVLRVAGFKNNAPQFHFIGRKDAILCIDCEKTCEVELQNAVKNAVDHLIQFGASLEDYTSYADTSTFPGHYVLFWELRQEAGDAITSSIPPSVFEECCFVIEESLGRVYREFRVLTKTIGPLEIKIVETGTFSKLMDYAISRGTASTSQYKTPRCVTFAPVVELLNSRVQFNYFSTKLPSWP